MSKIKVNEIESSSTNVKLAAKGSGVVKVKGAGGADGTLQLNSGTHNVKIKSPAHSAGQSYTMVLPDNNIETDKYLRVKSITGSGATATGQLEYATIPQPDITNLNATHITSGTVPAARFGTTIAASVGALQLVSKTTVGSTAVSSIDITGFESGYHYLLIAKCLKQDNNSANYVWLDEYQADGSTLYRLGQSVRGGSGYAPVNDTINGQQIYITPGNTSQSSQQQMAFVAEINNAATRGSIFIDAMHMGVNAGINYNFYQGFMGTYGSNNYLHTMKIMPVYSFWNFTQGSEVLLYRYGKN
tara:strand:+ start:2471 stop:3373 length:903 start_codon:yes stop_codon:yes gene_type:complete